MSIMKCSKCEKDIDTDTFGYDFKNDVCDDCIVHYCEDCKWCKADDNDFRLARCVKSKEFVSENEKRVRRISDGQAYCSSCRDDNTCEHFEEK